jgi:hypothetical protein
MFVRFDDWIKLPGAEVEIWIGKRLARVGVIDAATDDSSIAWVAPDGPNERRILEKAHGVELRVSPFEMQRRAAWPE